jgi:hypothetical protein
MGQVALPVLANPAELDILRCGLVHFVDVYRVFVKS